MKALIEKGSKKFEVDLSQPIDISLVLKTGTDNVNAFYIPPVLIEPIRIGSFVGSVEEGGSCNVNNITFNPHGNGTHTECVGHISKQAYFLKDSLKQCFFKVRLISVQPEKINEDLIITAAQLEPLLNKVDNIEALIIRTLPNSEDKKTRNYSGTNPCYLHPEAAELIRNSGIDHLLIDLPSVDKENDDGMLSAHHAFWNYPTSPRLKATITELVFIDNDIRDGDYFLNLQVINIENDASPSKPVLFEIKN